MADAPLLMGAIGLYAATAVAWRRAAWALLALAGALVLHTVALGLRWQAHGHGPFTTMHEILSSSLWSLALVVGVAAWRWPRVRQALWAAVPVWWLLAGWLLVSDPRPGHLPPTYDTLLLYLHALVGKLFLGLLLVATALGLQAGRGGNGAAALDALAHRFAAFALVFESLMLIVGAVWAQDAWGRYWAWDPLESWSFVTWLALVAALHGRQALRPAPRVFGLWLAGVFVLAFLTFFGVPFLSVAPHKGAI